MTTRPKPPSTSWPIRAQLYSRDRWALTRRRIRPTRLALQLAVTALAISLLSSTLQWGLRARTATDAWGTRVPVVVADRDLDIGEVVELDDLRRQQWPAALVGTGATAELDDVLGRVVSDPILAGEPVAAARLGAGRLGLDPDESAVTLVPSLAFPPVEVGDRVELFTVMGAGDGLGGEGTATRKRAAGRVIAQHLDGVAASLTVAVPNDTVADLVEAQAMGIVEVVIVS